jgi:ATP-binding cassette subfamily C protein LapB
MIRAAQLSGTHEFMGKLANGYELKLADRGESLSGGQRQSIAVARALAGKPSILLLDEPTSAMDNQTEMALIERLNRELKDRTALIITHRLPLLNLVSRIILLDQGKVIADGPRDEVLKQLTKPQQVTK